jgi:hypothetical protein
MQGLDLVHAVDRLIEWGDLVDKRLRRIESTLARLESQVQDLYGRCSRH